MAKKKSKLLELDKELLIRIGTEKDDHAISWDILKNLGDKLEMLILTIARYNPEASGMINTDNIKLDFSGFYKGSSIPAFKFNSHPVPSLFNEDIARQSVIEDFTKLVGNVDAGNYQAIADKYTIPAAKNDVIKKVYEFTNSAGSKPVSIVKRVTGNKFKKIYAIRKLRKEIYDQLIVREPGFDLDENTMIESTAIAQITIKENKAGKISRKASAIYPDKEATISLKFDRIIHNGNVYTLFTPVLFQLSKEGKGTILENEQLDLYAGGATTEEAKLSLFEQFDHNYSRLNELTEDQLGEHLLQVKKYYNLIVKSVTHD